MAGEPHLAACTRRAPSVPAYGLCLGRAFCLGRVAGNRQLARPRERRTAPQPLRVPTAKAFPPHADAGRGRPTVDLRGWLVPQVRARADADSLAVLGSG